MKNSNYQQLKNTIVKSVKEATGEDIVKTVYEKNYDLTKAGFPEGFETTEERDLNLEDVLITYGIENFTTKEIWEFLRMWNLNKSLEWHRDNKPEVVNFLYDILNN